MFVYQKILNVYLSVIVYLCEIKGLYLFVSVIFFVCIFLSVNCVILLYLSIFNVCVCVCVCLSVSVCNI